MRYDFSVFTHVTLTGIDISTLNEDELSALYQAACYCQAMTEATSTPCVKSYRRTWPLPT